MAICSYNGNRIIPAPFVNVSKSYQKSADGGLVGSLFTLTISGTILAFKGSPDSAGVFYTGSKYPPDARDEPTSLETIANDSRLAAILRKEEALRELFSEEGHSLEFQSFDGSAPMKCNPRINSITFEEGLWFNTASYTIICEADVVSFQGVALGEDSQFTEYIASANENWSIETDEGRPEAEGLPRTYRMSHSINAVGKRFYDETGALEKPAWQQARDWVCPRMGFDSAFLSSSGVRDIATEFGSPVYADFNHVRSENIDENGGTYSIVETWLLASGIAIEDFNISTRNGFEIGTTSVNIEGNIAGLEKRDSNLQVTTSKYTNALTQFNTASGLALSRAQTFSGISNLNITPISDSVSRNPITGNINYSFEYSDRPSRCIDGALSEVITITNSFGIDVFAAVSVLGRAVGPVLQAIGTRQALTRGLNIELAMNVTATGCNASQLLFDNNPRIASPTSGQIQNFVDAANPTNQESATQVFVSQQQESWEPRTGRYSFNVEWVYEI